MNAVISRKSSYSLKRTKSLECTCEFNNIRSNGKKAMRYSMCDICSERLFANIQFDCQKDNQKDDGQK